MLIGNYLVLAAAPAVRDSTTSYMYSTMMSHSIESPPGVHGTIAAQPLADRKGKFSTHGGHGNVVTISKTHTHRQQHCVPLNNATYFWYCMAMARPMQLHAFCLCLPIRRTQFEYSVACGLLSLTCVETARLTQHRHSRCCTLHPWSATRLLHAHAELMCCDLIRTTSALCL